MTDEQLLTDPSIRAPDGPPRPAWMVPITVTCLLLCTAVHGLFLVEAGMVGWDAAGSPGYRDIYDIWDGAWWALVTSAFVHFDVFHFLFNAFWVWRLGARVEREIPWPLMLALVVGGAATSSAAQIAWSGSTGVGFSGVLYVLVGFQWAARHRFPAFDAPQAAKDARLLGGWAVLCVLSEFVPVLPFAIANGAHLGGLAFGLAVGGALYGSAVRRLLAAVTFALLVGGAIFACTWPVWQPQYTLWRGYTAQEEERYADALAHYDRVVERWPEQHWAHYGRAQALYYADDNEAALEALHTYMWEVPDDADAWQLKGDTLYYLDRYDEAATALRKAIQLGGETAYRRQLGAWVLAKQDAPEARREALDWADRALILAPDSADAHQAHAVALWTNDRRSEAIDAQRRAVELDLDPSSPRGAYRRERLQWYEEQATE